MQVRIEGLEKLLDRAVAGQVQVAQVQYANRRLSRRPGRTRGHLLLDLFHDLPAPAVGLDLHRAQPLR